MPWLGGRHFIFIFFAILFILSSIHHSDEDLIDNGCILSSIPRTIPTATSMHMTMMAIGYFPIGPSPTHHLSGSCTRHISKLPILRTYLIERFIYDL